jgi:methyltransferase (TIGR00027 family)
MHPASTTPSRTAERVAAHRAQHQLLDEPRVFEDPLALSVLGRQRAEALQHNGRRDDDAWSRALRAFVVARSRLAEDQLAFAVRRGVRQYVVLGAGLDTFAYRNRHPALRVFEIDHPATQAHKRDMLRAEGIKVPASVQFVPVDFERDTLADGLGRAGFDASAGAFFSWLGVTQYLESEATRRTLAFIGSLVRGSGVTFDYALERDLLPWTERRAFDALAARVAAAGEPFLGFFRPDALARSLRATGFSELEDLDRDELNERYFAARADGLCLRGSAHVMTAWV